MVKMQQLVIFGNGSGRHNVDFIRRGVSNMELLAEKLFLLSIDKRTKRPYGRTASLLSYTLNAALLAELLMRECIVIRDKKVEVVDGAKEDGLLDETNQIIQSKRKQSPKQMIATLRREHKNIQVKLAKKLSEAGELDLDLRQYFGHIKVSFLVVL